MLYHEHISAYEATSRLVFETSEVRSPERPAAGLVQATEVGTRLWLHGRDFQVAASALSDAIDSPDARADPYRTIAGVLYAKLLAGESVPIESRPAVPGSTVPGPTRQELETLAWIASSQWSGDMLLRPLGRAERRARGRMASILEHLHTRTILNVSEAVALSVLRDQPGTAHAAVRQYNTYHMPGANAPWMQIVSVGQAQGRERIGPPAPSPQVIVGRIATVGHALLYRSHRLVRRSQRRWEEMPPDDRRQHTA